MLHDGGARRSAVTANALTATSSARQSVAIGEVEAEPERVEEIRAKDEANRRKHEEERNTRVDDFVALGAGANRSHSDTGAPLSLMTFLGSRGLCLRTSDRRHTHDSSHPTRCSAACSLPSPHSRITASTFPATRGPGHGLDLFGIVTAPPGHGKGAAVDGAAKLVPVTSYRHRA